jgi:phage baseplate assembly protein W
MATDFGTDLHCADDLDPTMPEVTGRVALVQAILRRLSTPPGSLFYDPDYGIDVREYVGEGLDAADLFYVQTEIERECLKDERVRAAQARVSLDASTGVLTISLQLRDATGPFRLVLSVDQVTLTLLSGAV